MTDHCFSFISSPLLRPLYLVVVSLVWTSLVSEVSAQTSAEASQEGQHNSESAVIRQSSKVQRISEGEESSNASHQVDHQLLTFTAPHPEWTPLSFDQIQKFSALGVVGGIKSRSILGLVLVEPATRMSLNDYAQALLDGSPLKELLVESLEEVTYLGHRALRIVYSGDEANGRSRYVNYVFLLEGKGYQVIAGGRVGVAPVEQLEEFSQGVQLTERPDRAPTPKRKARDETGTSWVLSAGRFQDALSGLKITPRGAWRIASGAQVKKLNPDATAGLIHLEEQLYILFFDRPCPRGQPELCIAWSTTERFTDLGVRPAQEGTLGWSYLGETRYFTPLYAPQKNYVYLYHSHVAEGRVLETLVWTVTPSSSHDEDSASAARRAVASPQLWAALPDGLSQISLLSPVERQSLLTKIYRTRRGLPRGELVRPYESWMRGRYHHFDAELTWDQPPGLWRVTPSRSRAHLGPRDALYTIEAPRYELMTQLRIVNNRHDSVKKAHKRMWRSALAELEPSYGRCLKPTHGSRVIANTSSRWTRCVFTPQKYSQVTDHKLTKRQRSWTYQLDTLRSGGSLVSLLSYAPTALFTHQLEVIREALEGGFQVQRPAGVVFDQRRTLTDERFRYQLLNLPADGTLRVKPLLGLGTAASLIEYHTPEVTILSFAIGNVKRQTVEHLIQDLSRNLSSDTARRINTHPPTRRPDELERQRVWVDGLAAERLSWPTQGDISQGALLVESAPLMYGVVAVGDPQAVRTALKSTHLKLFIH